MSLLEIKNLYKSFGGLGAVINFNFTIQSGELIGLIGPNGAGKTTVFNLITGVYRPDSGRFYSGPEHCRLASYTICQKGIARTFQNIRLFKDLSVIDNVKIAFHKNVDYSLFSTLIRLPAFFQGEKDIETKAMEYLSIFKLDHKRDEIASNLPYGEQRRLEIARALATQPTLLILDEPAAGMNPRKPRN